VPRGVLNRVLSHIHIRDLAIVERQELDLGAGMTALTGETGAGKSIVVDALALALGDRADASFIRHDCERAEISIGFDVSGMKAVRAWLEDNDLDDGSELLIRRTLGRDGRSRGYVNGSTVPMQTLRELGEMLIDIHGQHEHQSLLKPAMQLQILDTFGRHDDLLADIQAICSGWRESHRQLETLTGEGVDHDSRVELLSYQLQELEALGLEEGEQQALDKEHARLANASRLIQGGQQAIDVLSANEETNVLGIVQQQAVELEALAEHEPQLAEVAAMLTTSAVQIQDATKDLRHILESLELDPARLSEVEQRLSVLHELARKHRVKAEQLPEVIKRLSQELDALQNMDESIRRLQAEMDKAAEDYQAAAGKLSRKRKTAAKKLADKVSDNMQHLGMPGGQFEISITGTGSQRPSGSGSDKTEFLVSANPGQPLKPLNKVASGGELSRISLAIQVVTAAGIQIPTLIFDEVDVGIGGGVAEIVGNQLQSLADNAQVICVTHLPQVAAQADNHYRVSKKSDGQATRISIHPLLDDERIQEIARMLGGVKITEQSRSHAAEMIKSAHKGRKKAG